MKEPKLKLSIFEKSNVGRSSSPYRKVHESLGCRGLVYRESFLIGGEKVTKGCGYGDCFGDIRDENFSPGKHTRDSTAVGPR
ncbi:hypothetical protein TNCV_4956031 [Trichonephila clavipes]|nr:hypothetical protein TNCV_4956031 [Trichonephila clavipes]